MNEFEVTYAHKLFYNFLQGKPGGFEKHIFKALMAADSINKIKIMAIYPNEVQAYKDWHHYGEETFCKIVKETL